jgi:hypothetical protein
MEIVNTQLDGVLAAHKRWSRQYSGEKRITFERVRLDELAVYAQSHGRGRMAASA